MRNVSFFLAPLESKHRQLVVIDMASSDDREWTARLVVKTDLVEKRRETAGIGSGYCEKFAFSFGAYDADVALEFNINNYETKSAKELNRWCCLYPVSLSLKETVEGFEHPNRLAKHPNRLAKHLRNTVFTLDRVAAFQDDMDIFRYPHKIGERKPRGNRGKHKSFDERREHFIGAIKKHFGGYLDMEQLGLEENTNCTETKKEEIK